MNKLLDKIDRQLAKHRKEEKTTPVMPTTKVRRQSAHSARKNLAIRQCMYKECVLAYALGVPQKGYSGKGS